MADAREELQLEEELSASTLAALRQFMQQKEQQQDAIADAKEQRPVHAELPVSRPRSSGRRSLAAAGACVAWAFDRCCCCCITGVQRGV